jgi:hypothetical protein
MRTFLVYEWRWFFLNSREEIWRQTAEVFITIFYHFCNRLYLMTSYQIPLSFPRFTHFLAGLQSKLQVRGGQISLFTAETCFVLSFFSSNFLSNRSAASAISRKNSCYDAENQNLKSMWSLIDNRSRDLRWDSGSFSSRCKFDLELSRRRSMKIYLRINYFYYPCPE